MLTDLLSSPQKEDVVILDFRSPEPWDNKFVLFKKPPIVCYFVTAALVNKKEWQPLLAVNRASFTPLTLSQDCCGPSTPAPFIAPLPHNGFHGVLFHLSCKQAWCCLWTQVPEFASKLQARKQLTPCRHWGGRRGRARQLAPASSKVTSLTSGLPNQMAITAREMITQIVQISQQPYSAPL